MRYAKASTKCSKCRTEERVSGQRYCRGCRAAAERDRRRTERTNPPSQRIEKVLAHVARGDKRGAMSPELKAKLEALAARVAQEIKHLNAGVQV